MRAVKRWRSAGLGTDFQTKKRRKKLQETSRKNGGKKEVTEKWREKTADKWRKIRDITEKMEEKKDHGKMEENKRHHVKIEESKR